MEIDKDYKLESITEAQVSLEDLSDDKASVRAESPEKVQNDWTSIVDRDEREMAMLGKKQVLKRNFGFMSILGFSCTLMVTWEGIFSVFIFGLTNGGPGGLIYGYLYCWLGYLSVVASMAEMVSMAPTAGGWQSIVAWQACVASAGYLGGTMIQGLLVLNYPDTYTPKGYHGTLLLFAITALAVFFNTWLASHLPKVEGAILIIHVLGYFAILIPMTYLAPHSLAKEVFGDFINGGGFNGMGLSFFVGIITTIFAFLGADGAIHMCEEIKNASTVVPWSIMFSILLNGTLGFSMLIAVLFCIGDINAALESPTGFPFIEIFAQATHSVQGATAMTSFVLSLMIFATIAVLAAASRMMWAFARDQGLPGSGHLAKVDKRSQLPLYSIGCTTLITILLALINIGSAEAFNAVASLLTAGFLGSYIIPTGLILHKRLTRPNDIRYGPWHMNRGYLGILTNGFALIWTIIAFFFSFWPSAANVSAATTNWSSLIYGVVMIFSVVFYVFWGRKRYNGPIVDRTIAEALA